MADWLSGTLHWHSGSAKEPPPAVLFFKNPIQSLPLSFSLARCAGGFHSLRLSKSRSRARSETRLLVTFDKIRVQGHLLLRPMDCRFAHAASRGRNLLLNCFTKPFFKSQISSRWLGGAFFGFGSIKFWLECWRYV